MKKEDEIYFSNNGITSTSAGFLANLAKEQTVAYQEELDSANFIQDSISIISSGVPHIAKEGKDINYLHSIEDKVNEIAKMHAYCAWMRKAIAAKEEELEYWKNYSFVSWCDEVKHVQLPDGSKYMNTIKEADILATMSIKERMEFIKLDAFASTFGKLIHKDGALNKARKDLHKGLAEPVWTVGEGANTIIHSITSTCEPEEVDATFNRLQDLHRSYEQQLNQMKGHIAVELLKKQVQHRHEYEDFMSESEIIVGKLRNEYEAFIKNKIAETSKLKIAIPNDLLETHNKLNLLGKVTSPELN